MFILYTVYIYIFFIFSKSSFRLLYGYPVRNCKPQVHKTVSSVKRVAPSVGRVSDIKDHKGDGLTMDSIQV